MRTISVEHMQDEERREERGLPRRLSVIKDERVMEQCECILDILAALFDVCGRELRKPGRNAAGIARVRQIGMYVAHVVLCMSMKDVGRGFGRDRTTVVHACHLIEDLRDDEEFDRIVSMTENIAAAAFRHFSY